MQIAQIAPLTEAIPPKLYGGTADWNAPGQQYGRIAKPLPYLLLEISFGIERSLVEPN